MKLKKLWVFGLILVFLLSLVAGCAKQPPQQTGPKVKDLILSTTTSTVDTKLLDILVPRFEAKTGYKVKTISVGSGAAIAMGEKGEADVLLTHAPSLEKPGVDKGTFINYKLVMHNDFVIVGPPEDPAKIKGIKSSAEAFKKIADAKSIFISRGDKSGTNTKELAIWKKANITPQGSWYQQSGTGMGATLQVASEKKGYTLTDRGTYLAQKKNIQLDILVEGEKDLLNIYHVMQVNPDKFSKVNAEGAKAFVEFMVNPDTQNLIADFGKDKYGEPLFYADAGKSIDQLGK